MRGVVMYTAGDVRVEEREDPKITLKGRPVEMLEAGIRYQFFPELWAIRDQMTDNWGATYGVVRDSISRQRGHAAA